MIVFCGFAVIYCFGLFICDGCCVFVDLFLLVELLVLFCSSGVFACCFVCYC